MGVMATPWPLKIAVIAFLLLAATVAYAQSCPQDNDDDLNVGAAASTLHGTIILHHQLRTWLGLKLDQPVCDEAEIELTFHDSTRWRQAESLRDCRVSATGEIFDGLTGYYSTFHAIHDALIHPDQPCHPHPISPDPAKLAVPESLWSYRVSIKIDTRGNGHTDVRVHKSFHRKVSGPWLVYVSYWLNGAGDLVWVGCADNFTAPNISAAPGSAVHEPGSPFQYGVGLDEDGVNKIRFACRRVSASTKSGMGGPFVGSKSSR
jgi:hypothetical protein